MILNIVQIQFLTAHSPQNNLVIYYRFIVRFLIGLLLLRVSVEGSDNPITSEQPCQAPLSRETSRGPLCCVPGLDSMSPARSKRSASHAAGTHGWLPPKLGDRASGEAWYVDTICTVPPPDCGTPTTSRLYPFGAPIGLDFPFITLPFQGC